MPRIASIDARALAPDVERFRYTSFQDEVYTTTTLVQITDDGGAVGLGAYDSDSYGDWDLSPLETLRTIVPRLVGADPDDHDAISALLSEDGTSPFPPPYGPRSTWPAGTSPRGAQSDRSTPGSVGTPR